MVTSDADRGLIHVGDRLVGPGAPVFFIAEAGVNHNGDLDLAKQLVDRAAEAGADCVKFQTFVTEEIATEAAPKAKYHIETTGSVQSWFDLLKSQEMNRRMHEALIERCRRAGIIFLSTPYDEPSVDLLDDLRVPAFKIASTDANNIPFLRYVARKGRPMILSTAMCSMAEVRESVEAIRNEGQQELIVLHCTGSYPAPLAESHMAALRTLHHELDVLVGYSDHTVESINAVLAVALGAVVYERHFTLDRGLPGPDHRMSLTPDELASTIRLVRDAEVAMGSPVKAVQPSESHNRELLRKSIVARRDMRRGETVTLESVAFKRPGTGLEPRQLSDVLGKRLTVDIAKDTPLESAFFQSEVGA